MSNQTYWAIISNPIFCTLKKRSKINFLESRRIIHHSKQNFMEIKKCILLWPSDRNSRPKVFCKKGVLRNFAKFTGKQLCQSLYFNKVAGLRPANLLKKRLRHRRFPVNFVKFLRRTFFIEHPWWLLLFRSTGKKILGQS